MTTNSHSHSVTALVAVAARKAFEFLADPESVGGWSIGCMRVGRAEEPGIYVGRSLFDGGQSWFAIRSEEELLLVDYYTGTPSALVPRISARVITAETCALPPDHCYVTLTAWRSSDMSDDRWHMLRAAHEAEIWLIKSQIESAKQPATACPG